MSTLQLKRTSSINRNLYEGAFGYPAELPRPAMRAAHAVSDGAWRMRDSRGAPAYAMGWSVLKWL